MSLSPQPRLGLWYFFPSERPKCSVLTTALEPHQLLPWACHPTPGAWWGQGGRLCPAGRGLPWCPSPSLSLLRFMVESRTAKPGLLGPKPSSVTLDRELDPSEHSLLIWKWKHVSYCHCHQCRLPSSPHPTALPSLHPTSGTHTLFPPGRGGTCPQYPWGTSSQRLSGGTPGMGAFLRGLWKPEQPSRSKGRCSPE